MSDTRIVITDCDHESIDFEREVAREHGADLVLAQCKTEDEVLEAVGEAAGIIVQYAPITERVLAGLPKLKVVSRYGVGVDTIDVEAATRHGVAVCNVPDYGTEDVSDHALALALTLGRGVLQLDHNLRHGQADLTPVKPLHRFNTQTFGVVGLGLIGAATGRKAKGVGFTVIGSDPQRTVGETTEEGIEVVSFDDLIERSDVISLHVPLIEATHHLIDDEVLGRVKRGAILVNTCRGGVADTDAVLRALEDGRLAGAGLDVIEQEPLDPEAPIAGHPNVVFTPHAAWYSEESYGELKRRVVQNVLSVLTGDEPRNVLNPDALK